MITTEQDNDAEIARLKEMLARCLLWFDIEAADCFRAGGDPIPSEPITGWASDCGFGENSIELSDIREMVSTNREPA